MAAERPLPALTSCAPTGAIMAGDETRMDETRMAAVAAKADMDAGRRRCLRDVRHDDDDDDVVDDGLYDAALCLKCDCC